MTGQTMRAHAWVLVFWFISLGCDSGTSCNEESLPRGEEMEPAPEQEPPRDEEHCGLPEGANESGCENTVID